MLKKEYYNKQLFKFSFYGFFKNLKFFEPFFILYLVKIGLSYSQIGILIAIREISINLLELPTGIISDSVGRKKTLIFSFISYIIFFLIYFFFKNFYILALAMFIYALGDAFRTGTHKAMIYSYLEQNGIKDQSTDYYGFTRSFSTLGSALVSILAAILVFYAGSLRILFLFSIIPHVIGAGLIITYPNEIDGATGKLTIKTFFKESWRVFVDFINDMKNITKASPIFLTAIYEGYYKSVKEFYQPILKTFAIGLTFSFLADENQKVAFVVGIAYFIIYMLSAASSNLSGNFKSLFKNYKTPAVVTLFIGTLAGAVAAIFARNNLFYFSFIFFTLVYIVENLRKPIQVSYISESFDSKILATALSATSSVATISAALISISIGFLADYYDIYISFIIISAIITTIS
ncbi:MAG: MFS transporter, partial [Spirochaetales bacterium]|nr:MFS transporter [Spirochaetales bacterium]